MWRTHVTSTEGSDFNPECYLFLNLTKLRLSDVSDGLKVTSYYVNR